MPNFTFRVVTPDVTFEEEMECRDAAEAQMVARDYGLNGLHKAPAAEGVGIFVPPSSVMRVFYKEERLIDVPPQGIIKP